MEHRLGPVRFLLAYLATGLAATLVHSVLDARSVVPVVGASGAISGVLGFYFIWFPRNRVRLLVLFPLMHIFYAPARLVLGIYLIVQNLFPFLASRGIEEEEASPTARTSAASWPVSAPPGGPSGAGCRWVRGSIGTRRPRHRPTPPPPPGSRSRA